MKKYFIVALMAAMCFVLVACGSQSGSDSYEVEKMEIGTALGNFASTDLDGNEVTDAIFAEKDVTILNIWGTYCGPCKEEMPGLAALDEELPDNVQIIGMVIDVPEGDTEMIETAKEICKDNNITYTNIVMNESVEELLSSIEAIPTTFILDSEGKTICTPIIGADLESYRSVTLDYLESIK